MSLDTNGTWTEMRTVIFLACLLLAATAMAETAWYVAPQGDDAAVGSREQPFATVQRAQEAAVPGDTVFLRGGTYRLTELSTTRGRRLFARIIVLDKSGEPGKPITYRAYQDEKPVFDCSDVKPLRQRVTAFYVSGSWLHLQGIEVTGVQVTITTHTQSICFESQGSHNVFERLAMHDGQAIGIYHVRGSDNLFLNCDAWNNWDHTSEDGKGGNVDGFGCHPTEGSTGNVFRGCRAWFNSDDGYDCIAAHESVTFENCWAAFNGLSRDGQKLADGNGFKAGGYGSLPARDLPQPIPRHVVRHCVAFGNRANGFYANHHPGGCDWIHNTAFRNSTNFNMLGRLSDNHTDVDGVGHKLVNNLSYGSRRDLTSINLAQCELSGNSFTLGLKLTDKDFASLDALQFTLPRQPDGKLPVSSWLRPTVNSQLVGGGTELRSVTSQPTIGAFAP